MFSRKSEQAGWEVYPSVDVAFGQRLLAENLDPYGNRQDLSIEVDTEAAVEILNILQPDDAHPTGVHFEIVDNPIESKLLRAIDPSRTAIGSAQLNKDKTVSVKVSMDTIPRGRGSFGSTHLYVGSTVVHELTHATDFTSKKALRQDAKHQRKSEGPVHKRIHTKLIQAAMSSFADNWSLPVPGGYITIRNINNREMLTSAKAKELYYGSPFEKRAYKAERAYRKLPQVINIAGINKL